MAVIEVHSFGFTYPGAERPAVRGVSFTVEPREITTFFFVAGLMLLERDEGTLTALSVSPLTPAAYLATRTVTLTALAAVETIAIVLIAFHAGRSWLFVLAGASALGVIYTASARLARVDVLILDDWGRAAVNDVQRQDLLEVMEDRDAARSTIITSQLRRDQWPGYLGDPTIADAVLDRVVHNAFPIALKGPSRRKDKASPW